MKYQQLVDDPEEIKKVSLLHLATSHGIYQDKEMAARGEAKSVIEVRTGKPSLADAMRTIEEARAKLRDDAVTVLAKPVEPANP
jgi:hypothetical protein